MPRSAVPIPEDETANDRFRRLASQRTNRVLEDLRKLGNLAQNPTLYDFAERDVEKIFSAVTDRLQEIQSQFERSLRRRGGARSSESF